MKTIILILSLLGVQLSVAQRVAHLTADVPSSHELILNIEFTDVKIIPWDKDKVDVKTTITSEKKELVDMYEIKFLDKRKGLVLEGRLRGDKNVSCNSWDVTTVIYVPEDLDISGTTKFGDVVMESCPRNMDLVTEFGDFEFIITDDCKTERISIENNFGDLDISIPEDASYLIDAKQEFGDMMTDLPLVFLSNRSKDDMGFNADSSYKLNGGQRAMKLDSSFGNVYLRKL